jgi:SEC-C motif-containing protein
MLREHIPPPHPDDSDACPCGSGARFGACCGPLLAGARQAATPEALMRSRYCAFVLGDAAYLLATWDPRTRPAQLDLADQPQWQRLEVSGSGQAADGVQGWVEFAAHYRTPQGAGCLRERSRFVREQGRWFYLDGLQPLSAKTATRPGRNDPCPCGSGRKFKHCCGR